jgi:hypothetical protein
MQPDAHHNAPRSTKFIMYRPATTQPAYIQDRGTGTQMHDNGGMLPHPCPTQPPQTTQQTTQRQARQARAAAAH